MSLATSGSSAAAAPAGSAPAADPALEAVNKRYQEGRAERDAGDFVTAAESFMAAFTDIPPKSREIRASVLFDLVDARRNAFAEGEGPGQICECQRLLVEYLAEVKQLLGARAEKIPDTRKARKLLAEVRKQIAAVKAENPLLDCATTTVVRPVPEPEPAAAGPDPAQLRRARTLVIAGGVTTGLGGVFLGVMAGGLAIGQKAEHDGSTRTSTALAGGAPLSEDDPELQSIVRRGKTGNQLAIAGGIIATIAVAAGVTMLVLGLRARKGRPARVALVPGGTGFTLRF
ncbi:MAG: hypothetical protein H0T76_12000 [Nannocystis sp.]|nr:hypothetical protein [Nannocystis sp.]MBA3547200.1 hypothetical protein [Nannocystis sp.]